MKHRSIGAFVLLAATLFAIPEAVQDIRSLKASVFERARGELLQAFLSFNSDGAAPAPGSRRQAREVLGPCPDSIKQRSLVASAAKKAPARAAAARSKSLEPVALADVIAEEAGEDFLIPAVAEFIVEAVEATREVAKADAAAAPRPGAIGGMMALPASVNGGWTKAEHDAHTSASGRAAREIASLDMVKAQTDLLKVDKLSEADLARLLSSQRVRQYRLIRRGNKQAPPPPALGGEVPTLPRQAEGAAEADASAHGPVWVSEKH